ncbi:hypothetical protein GH5_06258 [Leishmania sp. Ghana 2012 LV757]|uniref:hypothetical protein n=1 Tax=Leishmania sp. Ghana 2012 LV757 TaxID=2803181 RepID=UPI001B51899C|nr:hypothetical protein GH5_06258 [Leishmania sp. Ghana 2012 LV757]
MQRPASSTPVRSAAGVSFNSEHNAKAASLGTTCQDRSTSSNGSRWATEGRLAICKNPSFPIQQTAPKPYLAACAEITPKGRNWNAEFQLAWEMESHTLEQADLRMRTLHQLERDFEGEAVGTVVKIVRLEKDMPAELLNFVQCFRVRNIFFRILPDSRSGRNYVASLRGILQSDSRLLSVPLSTMFYYRGMPVLAQALVPMSTQPKRLYGSNSTNDVEVEAELTFIAEALHIPFPDSSMEVYEALDGRYYVTNSNATLTPLFVDDTIMKRQEMLRVCPEVVEGADNTMQVLDDGVLQETVLQVCCSSTPATVSATLTQVCEYLHARGVNLCLLKQVARRLLLSSDYDARAVEQAVELLACEMLCRSLKQEFYIEIQGKRTAYDELLLKRTLSKYFGMLFAPSPRFRGEFLNVVSKKYGITSEDRDLIDVLVSFRAEWKPRIMDRVCHLLGATIRKENGGVHVAWRSYVNSSVLPRLVDPAVAMQLAAVYSGARTEPSHWYAFCMPLRWKVACWQRNFSEALSLVREDATAQEKRTGPLQLIRLRMELAVCHVSFQTRDWPQIQEGRSRFPAVLAGYEEWASLKTQGRHCIEYGFWLVDVAEALMETPAELRGCVEEAVHYFYTAIARMPAYLRSEHGAWLHLQPYMGLLRCKKLLPSCSVDTCALVQHSLELSKVGWASDFFINFLRELGRQLEYEGSFEDAIQVLLTAVSLSKEKPTVAVDLHTFLMDAAHVYRSWDLRMHADACMALTREAVSHASQYYGVESREYGVVLNNRGAIEIELGLLDHAKQTLRNAGAAFDAAGVSHGDPDYDAYVRNVAMLLQRRHPSQTPPTPLHRFLRRFPFLESACQGLPWDDIRPLEDGLFAELARRRAQEADGTDEAYRLETDMKQRVGELFRVLLSGATLRQYPFLPAQVEGVYVEGLSLPHDRIFLELATQLHRMLVGSPAQRLQERLMLAYVTVKARRTAGRRAYERHIEDTFLNLFGASVNTMLPVDFSEVVEDAEVESLMHEYERMKAHRAHATELEEAQARLGHRVDAFESEQWGWRQSISTWLPDRLLHSCYLRDLSRDGALRDLLAARQHAERTGESVMPHDVLEARIAALCMSIWERGQLDRLYWRSESHQLQQRYRLSSPRVHLQPLSAIFEDLLEPWNASLYASADPDIRDSIVAAVHRRGKLNADAEYLEQWYPGLRETQCPAWMLVGLPHRFDAAYQRAQQKWQKSDASKSAAALARLRQYLAFTEARAHKARVGTMRLRLRTEAMYSFLRVRYDGVHVLDLTLGDDRVFGENYEEYMRLSSEVELPARRLQSCEERMRERAAVLAQQLRQREAALQQRFGSYLRSGDSPPQWSGTFIEYTPCVVQCEQYHIAHTLEAIGSKSARYSSRCAHEVRSYIRNISHDQFQRQLLRRSFDEEIAERYPYVPLMSGASVPISTIPFESRHEFRMLHATLFAPPPEAEEAVEDPTKKRRAATPVTTPLLCASLRAYQARLVASKARRLASIVEEMTKEEMEAQRRLVEAFPGIPHAILGVPTTQLLFPSDFEQQWSRAAKEGFNGPSTPGVYSTLVQCAASARALTLARQYLDELSLTSQPFLLYATRQCVSLRHLPLRVDRRYTRLLDSYDALLGRSPATSPKCSLQRVRLAARADLLAVRATRQWHSLLRQFHQPPALSEDQLAYLHQHPEILQTAPRQHNGRINPEITHAIVDELANHQRLEIEQAIAHEQLDKDVPFLYPVMQAADVTGNLSILPSPPQVRHTCDNTSNIAKDPEDGEHQLSNSTAETISDAKTAALQRNRLPSTPQPTTDPEPTEAFPDHRETIRDLRTRYLFLRLHEEDGWVEALLADEAFVRLGAEHAELMRDPVKNAAALRSVENAMNERGDAVAEALRRAAAVADLAARYPFLRLHEEDGWVEALLADEAFVRLGAEHAELMRDPVKNAAALRSVENAMNERGDAVAEALRRAAAVADLAARYPFLRLHEEDGWVEALLADEAFVRLGAEHAELMRDPVKNAAALRSVEDAMNERGDAVAEALRRAAAVADLTARYPFLRLHEEDGWLEALLADEAFVRLGAEHAELMRDPVKNAAALRSVENAMNERGSFLCALLCESGFSELVRSLLEEEEGLRLKATLTEAGERFSICVFYCCMREEVGRSCFVREESEERTCFESSFHTLWATLCDDLKIRCLEALEECVVEEAVSYNFLVSEEKDARAAFALQQASEEEVMMRVMIVAAEKAAAQVLGDAVSSEVDEAMRQLLMRMQESLAECELNEVESRRYVAAGEAVARAQFAITALFSEESLQRKVIQEHEEDSAMQTVAQESLESEAVMREVQSRLTKASKLCIGEEAVTRRALEVRETETREALARNVTSHAEALSRSEAQRRSVVRKEVLARSDVELDEKRARALLEGEWQLLENCVAAWQQPATESHKTHPSIERRDASPSVVDDSTAAAVSLEHSAILLQRIGRGRLLRKKLQNRLANRRRDILKQGINRILAEEFTERRSILGDEYVQHQSLHDQYSCAVPMALFDDPVDLALQQLVMAEESERGSILGDYMVARDAIERAEHKQFLKKNTLVSASDAPLSSDDDEVGETPLSGFLHGTESALMAGIRKARFRTRYKGFELDALGRFLLNYEKDLNHMQTMLTDFRRYVAMVHDQLKVVRDRAAQEVVRGGTGAMWVPARPLPLADLVRGPSTQYEGKRAQRAL